MVAERELNVLQIEKNNLQIKKTTSSIWQHTRCKCSQHNQTKKRAANENLYLVVLWAFAVRFFICLCCEHLQHLLSNWWRCFLDLLVLFLFACFFWSCSVLSSLGHRRKCISEQKPSPKVKRTACRRNRIVSRHRSGEELKKNLLHWRFTEACSLRYP